MFMYKHILGFDDTFAICWTVSVSVVTSLVIVVDTSLGGLTKHTHFGSAPREERSAASAAAAILGEAIPATEGRAPEPRWPPAKAPAPDAAARPGSRRPEPEVPVPAGGHGGGRAAGRARGTRRLPAPRRGLRGAGRPPPPSRSLLLRQRKVRSCRRPEGPAAAKRVSPGARVRWAVCAGVAGGEPLWADGVREPSRVCPKAASWSWVWIWRITMRRLC